MTETQTLPPELDPKRYVEKVRLSTSEVLDEPIRPEQLLVSGHRDYHLVDIHARYMMSRVVRATGREDEALSKMRKMRRLGFRTSRAIARMLRQKDPEKISKALFGLKEREYYFRYKKHPISAEEIDAKIEQMVEETRRRLAALGEPGTPRIKVLLTGGTGFVGKEIMWQAAHDDEIAEMVVLIRPKRNREGEIVATPAERGQDLLNQLWLAGTPAAERFRFVAGDIEEPNLGISDEEYEALAARITHVIHCAASVAFDDPYAESFRANVQGTLNALRFSRGLQRAPDSPFVGHLAIETSYIHGRQLKQQAREDEIVFPRNFYNNYYELTKAMASIETERFMLQEGLRVCQLCPAIVIGESRAGNNRGDTKVVNAPVNVFGRAHEELEGGSRGRGWRDRSSAAIIAKLATVFPGDPSAQINLIPVDRVAAGILAALRRPEAIGERVHLASANRVTAEEIRDFVAEEIGVRIKLAEPTLHRNVTLPVLTKVLVQLKQPKIARALDKLGTIFGGYTEWGQPIHQVGNDVRLLGLPEPRPDARHAFRMLCRHNQYVQEFGKIRDLDEISRREKVWMEWIADLEARTGGPVGAIPAEEFHRLIAAELDHEGDDFKVVGDGSRPAPAAEDRPAES